MMMDEVLVDKADLAELEAWAEMCDHVDHHGYCQTHGLGEVDRNQLCGIGRLIIALTEEDGLTNYLNTVTNKESSGATLTEEDDK